MKTESSSPEVEPLFVAGSHPVPRGPQEPHQPIAERRFRLPLSDEDAAVILAKLSELSYPVLSIRSAAAKSFRIRARLMLNRKRDTTEFSDPRLVAMAISSWAEIGNLEFVGKQFKRTKGAVINAKKQVKIWIAEPGEFQDKYHRTLLELVHLCRKVGITFPVKQVARPHDKSKVPVTA